MSALGRQLPLDECTFIPRLGRPDSYLPQDMAVIPKGHCLPFFSWCISGSRLHCEAILERSPHGYLGRADSSYRANRQSIVARPGHSAVLHSRIL